jgi:hypothetical protein
VDEDEWSRGVKMVIINKILIKNDQMLMRIWNEAGAEVSETLHPTKLLRCCTRAFLSTLEGLAGYILDQRAEKMLLKCTWNALSVVAQADLLDVV